MLFRSWGGAFNKEVKELMLGHAFKFANTVLFHVGETNVRSQKALRKIDAKLRKKIELVRPDGGTQMTFEYEVSKQEIR